MHRLINEIKFLFLCQNADWQCVIEAEDAEMAATLAVEQVFKKKESAHLAEHFFVLKLPNNLEIFKTSETKVFSSPIILANAGLHTEAVKLQAFLKRKNEK